MPALTAVQTSAQQSRLDGFIATIGTDLMAASAPSRPSPASHWAPMAEPNDLAVSITEFRASGGALDRLGMHAKLHPSCQPGCSRFEIRPLLQGTSPTTTNLHESR
jgi:hypothetical protein